MMLRSICAIRSFNDRPSGGKCGIPCASMMMLSISFSSGSGWFCMPASAKTSGGGVISNLASNGDCACNSACADTKPLGSRVGGMARKSNSCPAYSVLKRSTRLDNSRTFPGHGYFCSAVKKSGLKVIGCLPKEAHFLAKNVSNSGTSVLRSRNAGVTIGKTLSR